MTPCSPVNFTEVSDDQSGLVEVSNLIVEAVEFCDTSVDVYQTVRFYNAENRAVYDSQILVPRIRMCGDIPQMRLRTFVACVGEKSHSSSG